MACKPSAVNSFGVMRVACLPRIGARRYGKDQGFPWRTVVASDATQLSPVHLSQHAPLDGGPHKMGCAMN